MSADIKRVVELFLAERLTLLIPGHPFVPFTGGTATQDVEQMEPPFTVISIETAESTQTAHGVWICNGNLQAITHSSETTTESHGELVREIYAALGSIRPVATPSLVFHGLDINKCSSAVDESLQCRAGIIGFSCGVGG